MKFSVVTVCYNHAEFIRDTIESVLAQRYSDFEHIIVDGGSTDGTLNILREYPHLRWISEPDRGQSHALNKGFRMVTGDVVCWLNSDDWYPAGIFHELAPLLSNHPIVIGRSQLAHRDGTPHEVRENVARSWYDVLKYWVYHSSPDQPSIFFRKEVLDQFPLLNGDFIDEDLHFAMDYDWWLRIGERFPLTHHVDKILSYIRVYETAKTGAHMASVYREMSRVFRRHEAKRTLSEQNLAFVIPIDETSTELEPVLSQISSSTLPKIEVIFADSSTNASSIRSTRKKLLDLESKYPRLMLRQIPSSENSSGVWPVLDRALLAVRAPIAVVLPLEARISADLPLDIARAFEQDNLGLLIAKGLVDSAANSPMLTAPQAIALRPVTSGFAVRTVAYRELSDQCSNQMRHLHLRTMCLRLIHRAWITAPSDLLPAPLGNAQTLAQEEPFGLYTNCALLDEFRSEVDSDPFTNLRAKNGFALQVPDNLWHLARQHLQQAPKDWPDLHGDLDEETIRAITARAPAFGPARRLLAIKLAERGAHELAAKEQSAWEEISNHERKSPLYS